MLLKLSCGITCYWHLYHMKFVCSFLLLYVALSAAGQSEDSSCICYYTIRYPKEALAAKISGTVIMEMDSNERGILSNPIVITGIGYGCDEEAIRCVKKMIIKYNECVVRLKLHGHKGKVRQSFRFEYPEE